MLLSIFKNFNQPPKHTSGEFEETVVPKWIADEMDIVRSWKPKDGRDFRIVLTKDGRLFAFPRVRLSEEDRVFIRNLANCLSKENL